MKEATITIRVVTACTDAEFKEWVQYNTGQIGELSTSNPLLFHEFSDVEVIWHSLNDSHVSNNRRRMRKKLVEIVGHGMEPERAECIADEIISLYNTIWLAAMRKNIGCTPFCDGWHEYRKLTIK